MYVFNLAIFLIEQYILRTFPISIYFSLSAKLSSIMRMYLSFACLLPYLLIDKL